MLLEIAQARAQPGPHVVLAGVDDKSGKSRCSGCAPWGEHPAERAADEYDPVGVHLGHACGKVEHAGHDMLPVRTLRHTAVIENAALAGTVEGKERPASVEGRVRRRVQLFGGVVVPKQTSSVRRR
jgi:hypothetical protein